MRRHLSSHDPRPARPQRRSPAGALGRAGGGWVLLWLGLWAIALAPLRAADTATSREFRIVELEHPVDVQRAGSQDWDKAYTNQVLRAGDQVRTGMRGRAVIQWSDRTLKRMDERSYFRVPAEDKPSGFIELIRGIFYFFHRDKPGEFDIYTPRVSAVVRGTEFVVEVGEDGTTLLTLFDGAVELTNEFGVLALSSGQEGLVRPGRAPERTAGIASVNKLQWCLYYPGILHVEELRLTPQEQARLGASLSAYREGDLLGAVQQLPSDPIPATPAEGVYRAAALLAAGRVDEAQGLLQSGRAGTGAAEAHLLRLGAALRQLVAAVTLQPFSRVEPPQLATEWMAESYFAQSQSRLEEARRAARQAVALAPSFGLARARLAELEFSFGETAAARGEVERGLVLSPRNAQAVALRGFLLAAEGRVHAAERQFDEAIALDGALGNAWLGRGLCKIRRGETEAGLRDIHVAATVEPQRAVLRSYLGKAYSQDWDNARARRELELSKRLDAQDPTVWLYSALVLQQQNRINEAIADLEESQRLNNNRSVYRSQLQLDQDRAVRSANLANLYADAGMSEVSLAAAAQSVNADYANFSGHLFLANSYSRLQDPGRVTLRYESAAVSEYLVANLLAPVGAGALSPTVSQQEYSRLFESDRFGVVSATEYLSRGAWSEQGAVYGTDGRTAFSIDSRHVHDNGQTPNGDLDLSVVSLTLKQQISPQDHLFAQALYSESDSGDVAPRYDPSRSYSQGGANRQLSVEETQRPILLAGYHHEWSPGNHTLVLASRLDDTLTVDNPAQIFALVQTDAAGRITNSLPAVIDQNYRSDQEIYSLEAQQILERGRHTWIGGARYQWGDFETANDHAPSSASLPVGGPFFPSWFTNVSSDADLDFERASLYLYDQWQVVEPFLVVAGVTYDWMRYPENFRFAPLDNDQDTVDQISPKAGFIWNAARNTTFRGAYSRFLSGVSFDQSFRLEPSQVAGLNQAFRSVIPDAVAGANAAEDADMFSLAWDQRFPTRTYLEVVAQWLLSEADRDIGVYDVTETGAPLPGPPFFAPFIYPYQTRQRLDYEEQTLAITLNQLVGDDWAFGAGYRISHADLELSYPGADTAQLSPGEFGTRQELEAYLHQVHLHSVYNHPLGFFGRVDADWYQQSNQGYSPDVPGDDFWQFNAFVGYRFFRRQAEITFGVLNLTDEDYRLNPLNLTPGLPRERNFLARFRFNF